MTERGVAWRRLAASVVAVAIAATLAFGSAARPEAAVGRRASAAPPEVVAPTGQLIGLDPTGRFALYRSDQATKNCFAPSVEQLVVVDPTDHGSLQVAQLRTDGSLVAVENFDGRQAQAVFTCIDAGVERFFSHAITFRDDGRVLAQGRRVVSQPPRDPGGATELVVAADGSVVVARRTSYWSPGSDHVNGPATIEFFDASGG